MISFHKSISFKIAFLSLCLSISCNRLSDKDTEIRIGLITTLSGEFTETGKEALRGAELAIQEINRAGGLAVGERYHNIVLVPEDNQNIPEVSVNAARKLINQEKVLALVGPFTSSNAVPAASVAENARIPMISPGSSDPQLTQNKRYTFRMAFIDDFQGQAISRFAREELQAQTAAVLYDITGTHNRGITEVFQAQFEALGGHVVALEPYTSGEQDFRQYLERIINYKPDILFLPNYPDDVPHQIEQARETGLDAVFIGSDAWTDQTVTHLEDASMAEGAFYTNHWHPDITNEQSQTFITSYQQAYGLVPSASAALSYDAFGLLFQALSRQNEVTPESLRDHIADTPQYDGVSGTFIYQGNGDPLRSVVVVHIRDGQTRLHTVIEPETQ